MINFRIAPNLFHENISSANFCSEKDTIHVRLLCSMYPISYNKKYIPRFAIYRSRVNTSLKNKILFENVLFPSKLMYWYSERF